MPEEQVGVLARSQAALSDEKLATKRGLKELEARLTHARKDQKARMAHNLKELERPMILRLGSMMVGAVGAVAVLVKLL